MRTFTKRVFPIFLCFALVFTFSISTPASAAPKKIIVRAGHLGQPGSKCDRDTNFFAKLTQIRSEGKIEVKVYPASLTGKAAAQVEGVLAGTHDITIQGTAIMAVVPEERYWDLPFLFPDRDAVTKLECSPLRKKIDQHYLNKGLVLLGYIENGYRQHSNNVRPVYRPEDVNGLKHRTAAGPTKLLIWKTYGASPTPVAYAELYQALKQGVTDGQDGSLPNIDGSKLYEVQKYLSLISYVYNPQIVVAGKKFWDRIPNWAHVILKDACRDAALASRYRGIAEDNEYKLKFAKMGMQVNEISNEDKKLWRKASQPVYDALSKDIGKEFLQEIIRVVSE